MPIDKEKLANGRALVTGELGGALPANPLAAVIEAAREAFTLGRDPANWPDYLLAALGDVDSALEISAARAAIIRDNESAIAQARASNSDLRAALARADSDIARLQGDCTREGERANEAEGRNAMQETTIRTFASLLDNVRAAFDIGTAREELSGSPFASARNMATNAAIAFGTRGDPDCAIVRFVDSAIRLHGEAIAAKAKARNATESLHGANATALGLSDRIAALESELAEAREALADWHGKATRAEAHCERFQAVALAVGATPIGELPARVRAAYAACTDRGAALNRMERESGE